MRFPSRLSSTICGPPFSGTLGTSLCAWRRTMPPNFTEPVFTGSNGFETSYCSSSPVPQHETYRYRSSSDRLMSVTNGGTALKPFNSGGSWSGSAASAGISITLRTCHEAFPFEPSRYQVQIEEDRSFSEVRSEERRVGK